ncbi:MAG: ferredoxin [Solirubrobacterales bacterium]
MKAMLEKEGCISCGMCIAICPQVFQMEDDGKAGVVQEEVPDNLLGSAKEAEESCPVSVIAIS